MLKQVSQLGELDKSLANLEPHGLPPWGEQHRVLPVPVPQHRGGNV